jgi:hypothetical protein
MAANQMRLLQLERQTLQLKDVVVALEKDPTFAEELARVEFDAVRPGEEVLPVGPGLRLDPRTEPVAGPKALSTSPRWLPVVTVLAEDRTLRSELLFAAAVLVIAAFTWLHEPVERGRPAGPPETKPGWSQRLRSRYVRAA